MLKIVKSTIVYSCTGTGFEKFQYCIRNSLEMENTGTCFSGAINDVYTSVAVRVFHREPSG